MEEQKIIPGPIGHSNLKPVLLTRRAATGVGILTKEFVGDEKGNLINLKTAEVEWKKIPGERPQLTEIISSEKEWPCELALLALGFTGPKNHSNNLV